ncbi:MAG TPA: D-galactarate dehydratase [Firmicutes bacterium]|jgi:altronate dehydratase large subunit|nr:D-galactarate dehydratase [Bacillota bacterium]
MTKNSHRSWQGFLRQDGSKGIRNKVLVIYTVECSSFVAKEIAAAFPGNEVDVVGFPGCTDNEYAVRMLLSLIRHPNVGAVLPVGLGCEYIQAERLAEKAREAGRISEWLLIQECGGTLKTVSKGREIVTKMLKRLAKDSARVEMDVSDLIIGAECGGSDFTSGLAGNVVVGKFFDQLVRMEGTAIFEEIVEAIGLKEMVTKRAKNETARQELAYTYDKALAYCKAVRQFSISPGNFVGGLTTIEEKSMGALVKSGSQPIEGVLKVGGRPTGKGLWLLDSTPDPYWMQFGYTNPNDNEGLMDLISCGSQITFLVTGRGTVVGSAVAPVVKITGNEETYRRMIDDMDFCAGAALTGEKSLGILAEELLNYVIDICEGEQTQSEKMGHKEYFIPYKYQTSDIKITRCNQ